MVGLVWIQCRKCTILRGSSWKYSDCNSYGLSSISSCLGSAFLDEDSQTERNSCNKWCYCRTCRDNPSIWLRECRACICNWIGHWYCLLYGSDFLERKV